MLCAHLRPSHFRVQDFTFAIRHAAMSSRSAFVRARAAATASEYNAQLASAAATFACKSAVRSVDTTVLTMLRQRARASRLQACACSKWRSLTASSASHLCTRQCVVQVLRECPGVLPKLASPIARCCVRHIALQPNTLWFVHLDMQNSSTSVGMMYDNVLGQVQSDTSVTWAQQQNIFTRRQGLLACTHQGGPLFVSFRAIWAVHCQNVGCMYGLLCIGCGLAQHNLLAPHLQFIVGTNVKRHLL